MKHSKKIILSMLLCFSTHPLGALKQKVAQQGQTHFVLNPVGESSVARCLRAMRTDSGEIKQVFFSPDEDLQLMLVDLIDNEQKSIKLAIYFFTDPVVARACFNAHRRGVSIEVITDAQCVRNRYNKAKFLHKKGIEVFVYEPEEMEQYLSNIMHHKFVLFEKNILNKALLWTGSFNFTRSAQERNQENVLVLEDKDLVARYTRQYDRLKGRSIKLTEFHAKPKVDLTQDRKKRWFDNLFKKNESQEDSID